MMGKRVMAEPVFSTVRIADHLPANHLLRAVDALLDTAFVRRIMAPHYSLIGRPSIDLELMIRVLLVGYLGGIRSERKLCAGILPLPARLEHLVHPTRRQRVLQRQARHHARRRVPLKPLQNRRPSEPTATGPLLIH